MLIIVGARPPSMAVVTVLLPALSIRKLSNDDDDGDGDKKATEQLV